MTKYLIGYHQIIESALNNFNADFFCDNNIVFGGGTRIALELSEFRESVDIDFLCPNRDSYRAVREQVSSSSLGKLVKKDFKYKREVRADRDAVRTVIEHNGVAIKLEFVSFDNYELSSIVNLNDFPVPFLDQKSCFYTKLLANADRGLSQPYKDLFDIIAMYKEWGSIPDCAIKMAEKHYGKNVIIPTLIFAIEAMLKKPDEYKEIAKSLMMKESWVNSIVMECSTNLLSELKARL